jgi:diacylglycerol kinase (ATP)
VDRRLCLIVNPQAGQGRARTLLPAATAALTAAGSEHRVVESSSLTHARELAAEAAERGEVVVAVGGDGMAGALAGAASAAGASFGLIPAGRGNDLAGVLKVPTEPVAAAQALVHGQPRRIDLIAVSTPEQPEQIVASSIYAGLPAVAGEIANATRLLGGGLVYSVAALRALARWRPVTFTVQITGTTQSTGELRDSGELQDSGEPQDSGELQDSGEPQAHEFTGYAVVIANSAFFGAGMKVAPPARIDDGVLDIVLMRHAPKLAFVKALTKIKDGSHVDLPQVSLERGTEITLTVSRDLPAAADGEPLRCASPLAAGTPLRVRVLPAALSVIGSA